MTGDGPTPSRELRGGAVLDDPLVRELLEARLVAVLTTLEPDGTVHAIPVWYALAGDAILFATGGRSRKVRNLRRDPRATVVLHDSRPGCEVCGASIRGVVEVVEADEALPLVAQVHSRYLAPAVASLPAAAELFASDDVVLRLHPQAAVTWDERGSAAAAELRAAGAALPLEPTSPRPGPLRRPFR